MLPHAEPHDTVKYKECTMKDGWVICTVYIFLQCTDDLFRGGLLFCFGSLFSFYFSDCPPTCCPCTVTPTQTVLYIHARWGAEKCKSWKTHDAGDTKRLRADETAGAANKGGLRILSFFSHSLLIHLCIPHFSSIVRPSDMSHLPPLFSSLFSPSSFLPYCITTLSFLFSINNTVSVSLSSRVIMFSACLPKVTLILRALR